MSERNSTGTPDWTNVVEKQLGPPPRASQFLDTNFEYAAPGTFKWMTEAWTLLKQLAEKVDEAAR